MTSGPWTIGSGQFVWAQHRESLMDRCLVANGSLRPMSNLRPQHGLRRGPTVADP